MVIQYFSRLMNLLKSRVYLNAKGLEIYEMGIDSSLSITSKMLTDKGNALLYSFRHKNVTRQNSTGNCLAKVRGRYGQAAIAACRCPVRHSARTRGRRRRGRCGGGGAVPKAIAIGPDGADCPVVNATTHPKEGGRTHRRAAVGGRGSDAAVSRLRPGKRAPLHWIALLSPRNDGCPVSQSPLPYRKQTRYVSRLAYFMEDPTATAVCLVQTGLARNDRLRTVPQTRHCEPPSAMRTRPGVCDKQANGLPQTPKLSASAEPSSQASLEFRDKAALCAGPETP
jgi:hypothetical protein